MELMKLLLKAYFFLKPSKVHPLKARFPMPGKEHSRDYDQDWTPLNWTFADFKQAVETIIEKLQIPNSCTHEKRTGRKHRGCNHKRSNRFHC